MAGAEVRTDMATVLFTDMADSTEIRSRLGEERADDLRRQHDAVVVTAIEENRGTVVKHLGDGMMATFTGAADAVAGAVAIQQGIAQMNRSAGIVPVAVRIGLSVGDVTFEGDDCFGLPVVEAQRLESAAGPDRIYCSELVQMMSRGRGGHDFVSLGELELKGLAEPLAAVEVVWARADTASAGASELPHLLSTEGTFAFAGRDLEHQQLLEAWKGLGDTGHATVLVSGEPGIGKTRLVSELAAIAIEQGGVVLAGRCDDSVTVPFRPFVEALRTYCAGREGEVLADVLGSSASELQRLMPELASLIPGLAPPISGDPEFERFQTLGALVGWLRALAADRSVLLVLDDIHWADAPSLAALKHVVTELATEPVLIVGTYRDTDLDRAHPLAAMLADFRRMPVVTRLDLDGLTAEGVATLMSRQAGHELDPAGAALAGALYKETAGNPFFVGEVLRHLAESGAIVFRDGVWTSDLSLDEVGIPEGIREVVGRRLTRLDEDVERVLSGASVLGHEFEVDVLADVIASESDDILDHLDAAVTANLVHEIGVGSYRFAHALVRSTLLEELSTTRRARLHRRAAQVIEDRFADDLDEVAARLAFHWAETADPDPTTAVSWALRAGELALHQVAPEDALRSFASGLDLLDPDEPDRRQQAALLTGLAEARVRTGSADHDAPSKQAARIGLELGDPAVVAAALRVNARVAWTRGFAYDGERMELVREALALDLSNDTMSEISLLAQLAQELLFQGESDERRDVSMRATELAVAADLDPIERYNLFAEIGPTVPLLGADGRYFELGRQLRAEAAEAARERGDHPTELQVAVITTMFAFMVCDRSAFDESWAVLERVRPIVSDTLSRLRVTMAEIVASLAFGDLSVAEAGAERMLELATAQEDTAGSGYHAVTLFQTLRERGLLEHVLPLLENFTVDPSDAQGVTPAINSALFATLQMRDEANEVLEMARPFDDLPDDTGLPIALGCFAEAAIHAGHVEAAAELFPTLEAFEVPGHRRSLTTGCFAWGSLDSTIARMLVVLGRGEEADARFVAGIEDGDNLGATAWSARSRVDYAAFCLAQGRDDDARRLAQEALDLVEGTELEETRQRAEAILTG